LVLTDIVADDGTVGHSMIFTYAVAALKPTADLIKNLESFVKGEPLAPAEIADKFVKRFRLLGLQGLIAMGCCHRHGTVGCFSTKPQYLARAIAWQY
jgi:mandelate racemase